MAAPGAVLAAPGSISPATATPESAAGSREALAALPGSAVTPSEATAATPESATTPREATAALPESAATLREPATARWEREPIIQRPAVPLPAVRESAAAEPSAWTPAPWDQGSAVQDQQATRDSVSWNPWATREHVSLTHDQKPAPDRDAGPDDKLSADDWLSPDEQLSQDHDGGLDDDEPATQDQEAIIDDRKPPAAEHPQAGRTERLTAEQVRIAVRALGRCRLAEGRSVFGSYGESGLTPAMRRVEEQLDHGELVPETEKYALKSLDRFQEKLAKLIHDEPDKSAEEHAAEIHDGVRYTFLFAHETYTQDLRVGSERLQAEGFTLDVRKNLWGNDEYKGVNTRWVDPESNLLFEIQFHTEKSWDAKQQSHDAYEKINEVETPVAEKEQLRDYQREVSSQVPLPLGWQEIKDYRREG